MKPAKQWAQEFCNLHVLNVKEGTPMEEWVKQIQDDACASLTNKILELESKLECAFMDMDRCCDD